MAASSDDLFQLIKSLKQSEKRYFKIFSSKHVIGNQNNYVKLFEAIDKQEEYDEKSIIKKFRNEKFVKQFSYTKNYLYQFILKSLRTYYEGKSITSKINESLSSVQILFERSFYSRAMKILTKTKQLAQDYEKHELLFNIYAWEYKLWTAIALGEEQQKHLEALKKEREKLITIVQNKYAIKHLSDLEQCLYDKYARVRSDEDLAAYKTIIAHPLLSDYNNALSFEAKMAFNDAHAIFYDVQNKVEQVCQYDEQQLALVDSHPKLKEENLVRYIDSANNALYSYVKLKKFDRIEIIIQNVRALATTKKYQDKISKPIQILIFETTYAVELYYYLHTFQFERGLTLVPEIQKGLKEYKVLLSPHIPLVLAFRLSKCYFYEGQLHKALDWINLVVPKDKSEIGTEVLCFARILKLLIYFDLGESYISLLQSELRSVRRFLTKKKRLHKAEDNILRYMTKISNTSNLDLIEKYWQEFKDSITALIQHNFERPASSFLNILYWIDSKLENKPIKVIMLESR